MDKKFNNSVETSREIYQTPSTNSSLLMKMKHWNSLTPSSGIAKRSASNPGSFPFNRCQSPISPRPPKNTLHMFYNQTGNECLKTLTLYNKRDCFHTSHR